MVAGDIQKHGNERPEFSYPLELEAADFSNDKVIFLWALRIFNQRSADVAADKHFFPEHLNISPSSVVVVVLPLVPVTAITGTFKPSKPAQFR